MLSTLIYERLIGAFTLLLIGLIATLSSRAFDSMRNGVLCRAVLGLGFVAAACADEPLRSSRFSRWLRTLGTRFKVERAGAAAARTLEAVSALKRHPAMLSRTVVISVAVRSSGVLDASP